MDAPTQGTDSLSDSDSGDNTTTTSASASSGTTSASGSTETSGGDSEASRGSGIDSDSDASDSSDAETSSGGVDSGPASDSSDGGTTGGVDSGTASDGDTGGGGTSNGGIDSDTAGDTSDSGNNDTGSSGGDGGCGFHTHTQGGWGTSCAGNNPGCYRDSHFAAAFPDGLVVGCDVYAATLLNSAAVERALPAGGTPRALLPEEETTYDGSDADPTVKTVFFGQVIALALNVAFDANDDFKQNDDPTPLGELVIVDPASACLGMSVASVLAEANLALGACPSQLSPADLTACAALINESFSDSEAMCSDRLALPDKNSAQ
ncbi:hypothetical protein [Nannocystis radixulma]|uniref:Uncharacterized protein n=1 Tax=Nannocystis radixulma TaxID=2995305 RepID=A0ABT5BAT6_9BACT|nr:hypothetical protein [Nannocystis radixulma]MDC0670101.1 hypothetical protein [Nannocystis radixulma]